MKKQRHQVIRKETPQRKTELAVSNKKRFVPDAIFVGLLFLSVLVFFKEALLGNRTLIWDAADYYYPYFFSVSSSLRSGEMPLWNPFLFNGFPTIALMQAQVFYPTNLLFLLFSSFTPYTIYLSLILHLFIGGVSMYFLSGTYIQNRWANAFSAMVYTFSGFMIGHLQHVTMIEVLAWLPLVLLFLEKALLKRKLTYAVFAGFFFGISVLAGHPQTSHALAFMLVVHMIYRTVTTSAREKKKAFLLYGMSVLLICVLTGALIASVQILPTYELTRESIRSSALSFEHAAKSGQLSARDAVLLILPDYFGALTGRYWGKIDISQGIIYTGLLPFLLMFLALLFARKRAEIVYFFVMACFFFLLSLGENGPVFHLLYSYVPGFNYFRSPANTLFLYTFCAALLSGYGFDFLARGLKKPIFFVFTGIFILLCAALYMLGPVPPEGFGSGAAGNIRPGFLLSFGIVSLSVLIMAICLYYPRFKNFCFATLLLVTFADLYLHFSDAITSGLKGTPQTYEKQPEIITVIKKDSAIESSDKPEMELNDAELRQALFRIYTKPEGLQGTAIFGFNRAMIFRTFLVEGYEPQEMSRHRRLIETLSSKNLDNLLKITNTKYITSIDSGKVNAQRYDKPLPRTYIVGNAMFIDNDDRVLEELAAFDPVSGVIISGKGTDMTGRTMDASDWASTVSRYTGSFVEIRTQSRRDGFLVFSDTYYPGWQAWVDGVEYPVMRANYDFRAVQLPAGEHTVVFKFTPRYLKPGLFISLAGIFIVGLCLLKTIYPLFSSRKNIQVNSE